MDLRTEQRALTRRKILGAVLELVTEGAIDELSVPEVSRRSGVSVATIYRYYPTKDELLAAAAEEPSRQALSSPTRPRVDGDDDYAAYLRTMWSEFAHNLPLLRHQIASSAGREMRRARTARSRELVGEYVGRYGIDPASSEGRRLVSMLMLVTGSLGLVELHDRQELSVDESVEHALWALRALVAATAPTSNEERPR